MKYEMIFGDERLFDGAPEECFCVAKNVYDDRVFYKTECGSLFWLYDTKWKQLQFMSRTPLAMRRIIKTPVWTVSDKQSGRLPEVGAEFQTSLGKRKCVFTEGKFIFTVNDGSVEAFDIYSAMPLESPREKYERERDELLKTLCEQGKSWRSLVNELYEQLKPFKEETK